MKRRRLAASERGILAELKGILVLVVALVALVLIAIDIAYIVAIIVVVAGLAFAILVPDKKFAAPLGGAIILGGILYALYLTEQGALALSAIKGVP